MQHSSDAAVHWSQQNVPKRGLSDLGHHLDQKDGEAQAVKALVCQYISGRRRGIARVNQPVTHKALREYTGYDDEQNQQCDDATEKAWRSLAHIRRLRRLRTNGFG